MPITRARKEVFGNAKIVKTSENSKNKDKNKTLGINIIQVLCIQYPIIFQKKSIFALFNPKSEINTIYPIFAKELGFFIRLIDIGAWKINGTMLNTYKMVITAFLITKKINWIRSFEETFLLANVSLNVVLGMLFLTLSSINIDFLD